MFLVVDSRPPFYLEKNRYMISKLIIHIIFAKYYVYITILVSYNGFKYFTFSSLVP